MKKLRKQKYEIRKRNCPLVELIWLDHCGISSGGWTNFDASEDAKLLVCHSVGYLINETNDTYTLAGDFGQPPATPWGRVLNIGKALTLSKRVLSKKGK